MAFDLTDLRLFANVLEAGTITAGAAASCITLASASERIRGMESALGVPLLLRTRRGVSPTPAGRTLLQHALIVLQQIERMQGDLGDHASGLRGHVRLMCNSAALSDWLPDRLAGFLHDHPGMSVDLLERPSHEIVDALRHGVCEIGVLADSVDAAGLQAFVLGADPLVLVVPRGHALAVRRRIAFAEVLDWELVGLSAGSALDDHLAGHARRLGTRPRYRIRLGSFEAVCRMVGQGVGLAVVPRAVVQRCGRSAGVRAVALDDAWAVRSLVLCVRELDALPTPARQLVARVLGASPGTGGG
ncbi:LysR substrate-binding domain-containing protein [Acidovorax sp. BLS4]|uniref:LysR substrate-binding domain-containing protein n=1 Tax=Acidovorax sp. BLS4 TaxID=3273430 RepID=UPI002943B556|nr:LysR substrate-binding domain-containing protein [Paracidovorax avenae]WOI45546.1 LysR substrate-binding domain-containing protein [Paracidovorax avenae]